MCVGAQDFSECETGILDAGVFRIRVHESGTNGDIFMEPEGAYPDMEAFQKGKGAANSGLNLTQIWGMGSRATIQLWIFECTCRNDASINELIGEQACSVLHVMEELEGGIGKVFGDRGDDEVP